MEQKAVRSTKIQFGRGNMRDDVCVGQVGFSVGAESDDELEVSERMLFFMLAFYERYPALLEAPLLLERMRV